MNTHSFVRFGVSLFLLVMPLASFALDVRIGEQPSIGSQEYLSKDVYMAGGNVTAGGTVQGDLLATGGSVLMQGSVTGDIAGVGGAVTVLGDVRDDVRVAGGTIIVNGSVEGDVVVAGGQVTLSGKKIGGDVLVAGGTVRIDAPVSGSIRAAGGSIFLNAPVGGSVQTYGDQLTLEKGARIGGDLSYHASKEATIESGAVVTGKSEFSPLPDAREKIKQNLAALASFWFLTKFLAVLVGAFAIGYLFQRYSVELTENAFASPVKEFGRGLIVLIALPIISMLLIASVIGTPLGVLGMIGFVAMMVFGGIAAPIILGSVIYRAIVKGKEYVVDWKTITIGSIAYFIFGIVPIVGWFALMFFFLLTIGAATKIKMDVVKEWR